MKITHKSSGIVQEYTINAASTTVVILIMKTIYNVSYANGFLFGGKIHNLKTSCIF